MLGKELSGIFFNLPLEIYPSAGNIEMLGWKQSCTVTKDNEKQSSVAKAQHFSHYMSENRRKLIKG